MILGLSGGPLVEPLLERTKRWTMPVDDDLSLELDETEVSRRTLAWSVIKQATAHSNEWWVSFFARSVE